MSALGARHPASVPCGRQGSKLPHRAGRKVTSADPERGWTIIDRARDLRFAKPLCTLLGLLLAGGVAACAAGAGVEPDAQDEGIGLEPCQLSAAGLSSRLPAQCGRLEVAEFPDDPGGARIELAVAVLPAVSRNAEPDPLFFLAGGPGQSSRSTFPALASAFQALRQARDIVLVDQRGTGDSGALECPEAEEDPLEDDPAAASRWARACLDRLSADPRAYTTANAVNDLEAVRRALGYDAVNVYGISYGTRLALSWARMHPDRVRSMVLDGVLDPEVALGSTVARDAQSALDLIFARCADDAPCADRFGDLDARFDRLMRELDENPVSVRLDHPVTAEPIMLDLGRERAAVVFRFASYAPETVALIPLLIDAAEGKGDYRPMAAQYLLLTEQIDESIASGLHYSVVCAEDVPYFDRSEIAASEAGTYLGDLVSSGLLTVCAEWPVAAPPADARAPVALDTPSLLLSGEADPITPPRHAAAVALGLPQSLHVIAPGQGHGVVSRGCIPDLVAEFVDAGSPEGLDADCVAKIAPADFFLDYSGPQP